MTNRIFAAVIGLLISSTAMAQEYGMQIGLHQTNAKVDAGTTGITGSTSGRLGFDLGLAVAFELMPGFRFRSGLMYNQRQFDYKITNTGNAGTLGINFAYLDVPVMVQYNFNPMFAVYGGLIAGIKASDTIKTYSSLSTAQVDMKSLYPLLTVGGNFTFDDMIGFDLYYEMGMGEFATAKAIPAATNDLSLKDYSTFGMHFLYWF